MISTNLKTAAFCAVVVALAVHSVPVSALTSTSTWQNIAFLPQTTNFVAQFDAVPNAANIDGVIAMSPSTVSSYTNCAVLVRFNSSGMIDARSGSTYLASTMAYASGKGYHFRVVTNMAARTYSVYVTPQGGAEQALASGCAFRAEQASASSLGNWALIAESGGFSLTNNAIGPALTVDAGPSQSITLPATASLNGTVTVNGLSTIPAGTTITWAKVSGPGTVTFSNAYAQATTASFSTSGSYQLQITVNSGGQAASDTVAVQVASAGTAQVSTTTWQNNSLAAQTGVFTAEFDATPNAANMDGVVGLSASSGSSYSNYAVMVRFNSAGMIDARDGGIYDPSTMSYTPGKTYHFRLLVSVPAKTCGIYVTPAGGTEQTLGTDCAFRSEQASTATLAIRGIMSEVGTFTFDHFKITPQAPSALTASAGADKTITTGQSTTLSGTASGGTSPYTYSWSPTTGLSSATIASPMASPTATTTYTLTVRDAAGQTTSDSAVVTVNPASSLLIASAGANKAITAGQSTTLSGTASGGVSPYTYSWSPTTGLSSATIAGPAASPAATTTYTLTVRDAAGVSATSSMTLTVTPTGSTGTTYYVNPNGNDSNPGTAAAPWKTLSKAGSSVNAGSTVIVQAGTYSGSFRPTVSGTSASAMITFKSETSRGAKITGGADLSVADYVRLEGFDITNPTAEAYAVTIQGYSSTGHGKGVQVVGNYIHDGGGHAVWACNVTDLLIENNEMYNNYHDGVIVTGASRNSRNVTIRGNYIHHNGQDGIHPEGFNFLIENNHIDDQYSTNQHQDGLEIYGPIDGMIIRNNIISDTTQNIYVSAENYAGSYIRNVQILGNIVYARNNPNLGKGIFVVGNTADVTNIRVEGNTFAYVAMNPFTDAYASSSSCYISGLVVRDNIFYMCDMSLGLKNPATVDYNIHYYPGYFDIVNNGGTYYTSLTALSSATGFETHGLQVDPLFVNPAGRDFHLTANSPAINKGIAISGLTSDYDGTPRPLGGIYDIGAYEEK